MLRSLLVLVVLAAAAPSSSRAQVGPPLQADVRVRAKGSGLGATFERQLEPGVATVAGSVRNMPGNDTALVTLHFDYKINADIAFDEIIGVIVIWIEDLAGNEISRATIDPNTVHLNPNRVPLDYSATLYKPAPRSNYIVRVQVFGNYE